MAESVSGLLVIGLTLAALLSRSDKSTQASAQQPPGSPVPRRAIGIGEVRDMAIIIVCAIVIGVIAGFTCGILVGLLTSG
jgi:hypothetical protein